MTAKHRRMRPNGRSNTVGRFFALPAAVTNSQNYRHLSSGAVKLMIDLGTQYNGKNNGDLCAAFTLMKRFGWRSKDTLTRKITELRNAEIIELSKQGGLHMGPNLYAFTWLPIDECGGKLDVPPTKTGSKIFSVKK
ncbi:MAG: Uncharacterised protein [Gammaproteobacteria bacterium]|nr:MAG: Uncharacterised protein [Gammaproteobacteria bacterium]